MTRVRFDRQAIADVLASEAGRHLGLNGLVDATVEFEATVTDGKVTNLSAIVQASKRPPALPPGVTLEETPGAKVTQ